MTDKQLHKEILKVRAIVKEIMKYRQEAIFTADDDLWINKQTGYICNACDCWSYHKIVRETIKEELARRPI